MNFLFPTFTYLFLVPFLLAFVSTDRSAFFFWINYSLLLSSEFSLPLLWHSLNLLLYIQHTLTYFYDIHLTYTLLLSPAQLLSERNLIVDDDDIFGISSTDWMYLYIHTYIYAYLRAHVE